MTEQEKRKLASWWWGRSLPTQHADLASLNPKRMSDAELALLMELKEQILDAQAQGITLDFGQQLLRSDLPFDLVWGEV